MLDRIAHLLVVGFTDPALAPLLYAVIADVLLKLRPELAKLAPYSHRYAWIKTGLAALIPRLVPAAIAFTKAGLGAKHPDVEKLIEMGAAAVPSAPMGQRASGVAGPGVPPRGQSGFVDMRPLKVFVLLGMGAIVIVPALVAMLLHGCSGTQHRRSWDANAHIAVNGATHVLRAIDTGLSTRYSQLAPDASDLAAFERPYQTALRAEHDALDSLLTAEHQIDAAVAIGDAPSRCRAGVAVEHSRQLVTDALNLASDFGVHVTADTQGTVGALESLATQLAPSCADGGV
ncbi:MAG TPA: hypothetical protein VLT45_18945 [Kofleriaceae bacterium]|nr:hypothetical protein [Kofleriaceae bacterium]